MPRRADETDAYIGVRMAMRRANLGLTQSGLAQQIGISFQQVQKYESGINRVSASRLHQIAARMEVPIQYFLPDSGFPAPPRHTDQDALAMIAAFPAIQDPSVRLALTCIVQALATT